MTEKTWNDSVVCLHQQQMTAEEQAYEEERLADQFTLLLQDLETYLQPVTAELDALLRYRDRVIFVIYHCRHFVIIVYERGSWRARHCFFCDSFVKTGCLYCFETVRRQGACEIILLQQPKVFPRVIFWRTNLSHNEHGTVSQFNKSFVCLSEWPDW